MFTFPRRGLVLASTAVAAGTASALMASSAFAAVEWTNTETPDIGADYGFESLEVLAEDDAWAVGTSSGGDGTVAAHWDGTAWTHTPTPKGWDLMSVSAATSDDVWAAGRGESGSVLAHWDGTAWGSVDSPAPEVPDGQIPGLYAVDADGSGNAWAGGCGDGDSGSTAFAQSFDGDKWTSVKLPVPDGADNSCVFAIDYVADDNVRVYGTTWDKQAWILHWNGHEWTTETTPENSESVTMTDSYINQGELCASGYTLDADLKPSPYLLCRDGETWTEVETPELDAFTGGIGPDGDGGMYLTGSTFGGKPVLLRYDGETVVEETPPSAEDGSLTAVASAPGSTRVWLAGTAGTKGLAAHSG